MWLIERGHGKTWQEIAKRYSRDQFELVYYLSRKSYFKRLEQEIDLQSKAIAGRLGEAMSNGIPIRGVAL